VARGATSTIESDLGASWAARERGAAVVRTGWGHGAVDLEGLDSGAERARKGAGDVGQGSALQ
jgi:hypothetical protein